MTINIEDIKPGDTVTLEHPDGSRLVRIAYGSLPTTVDFNGYEFTLSGLIADGWTITAHKPKVELPAEPGIYLETAEAAGTSPASARIWRRIGDGCGVTFWADGFNHIVDAPTVQLTRLVLESENRAKIAAEVIEWLAASDNLGPWSLAAARKHFGVES